MAAPGTDRGKVHDHPNHGEQRFRDLIQDADKRLCPIPDLTQCETEQNCDEQYLENFAFTKGSTNVVGMILSRKSLMVSDFAWLT
jgi:hypothetical protein